LSPSTGNTSVTVFTELYTGEILPANVPLTANNAIVREGYIFGGWYVGDPDDNIAFDPSTFSTLETATIKAKWLSVENCCAVKFNNVSDVLINMFAFQYPGNTPYNTRIIIPDWYDDNSGDWGGAGTKEALEKWTAVSSAGSLDGDYKPGNIVYITEDVTFTAVLDATVKGVSTRDELEVIGGSSGQFRLMQDIDISGSDWTPISGFSGVLNGSGHMITGLNFASNQTATVLGFFGELSGKVDNLTIGVGSGSIAYTNLTGDVYYGVFAGKLAATGKLLNTSAIGNTVSVTATNDTSATSKFDAYVGGIVGSAVSGSSITNSSSRVNVTTTNRVVSAIWGASNPFAYAGGIAGILSGGSLTNIYSTGDISAVSSVAGTPVMGDHTTAYAGGIAGYQASGGIQFSYAAGNISATVSSPDRSYAYAGGIVGEIIGGSIENSLGINVSIKAVSPYADSFSAGRVAGLSSGSPAFTKIYGNSDLENLPGVNGEERAYYFMDLDWFWHDYNPPAIAFNRDDYYSPGFDDAYPWIDPHAYPGMGDVKYPIFYWELPPQN
jgi:hypothetical protein